MYKDVESQLDELVQPNDELTRRRIGDEEQKQSFRLINYFILNSSIDVSCFQNKIVVPVPLRYRECRTAIAVTRLQSRTAVDGIRVELTRPDRSKLLVTVTRGFSSLAPRATADRVSAFSLFARLRRTPAAGYGRERSSLTYSSRGTRSRSRNERLD